MTKMLLVGLCTVLTVLLITGLVEAQRSEKVFHIGYLHLSTGPGRTLLIDAFVQELAKYGWVEGRNIIFDFRFAEQNNERLPEVAVELVRSNIDVLVASSTSPALAAKKSTTTTPIVFIGVGDPVASGLVGSLARPGGNITGVSDLTPDLITKRLETVKDAVPNLARVGLLRPPEPSTGVDLQLKELRPAALALKLKLEEIDAQPDARGLESAFQTARQKQVDAITAVNSPRFFAERKRIVELAAKNRLPAIYVQKEFVDDGGLMSYGVDYVDLYRRAAVYVDKILRGTKPNGLPVEQATKFEFVINLKAAKQIGLPIPVDVLAKANQVIR
jgi:putative ABC transport system substrate-binding protein